MSNNLTGADYRKSFARQFIMIVGMILFVVFGILALRGGANTYIIIFSILSILGLILFLLPLMIIAFSKQ